MAQELRPWWRGAFGGPRRKRGIRPTGRPVSRGSTQAMWNTPNGSPSPAGGVAPEHTYNNRATRAKATLACHVAGDQQVYGRPRSATITAGQLQSAVPRGPPGEESPPSGGRNSVVRARASPPLSIWVGFRPRHTAGRAELYRFRRIPALVGFHAGFANQGLAGARSGQICASSYASIRTGSRFLFEGLSGGVGVSGEIRPWLAATRVSPTRALPGRLWLRSVLPGRPRAGPGGPGG